MEKFIKIKEIEMPIFEFVYQSVEQLCASNNNYKSAINEDIIDITNLDLDAKAEILDLIIDKETLMLPTIFNEEYFSMIPNGRELHNTFFTKINMIYRLMDLKKQKGELTSEIRFNDLMRMLLLIKEYKNTMTKLFQNVYEQESNMNNGNNFHIS